MITDHTTAILLLSVIVVGSIGYLYRLKGKHKREILKSKTDARAELMKTHDIKKKPEDYELTVYLPEYGFNSLHMGAKNVGTCKLNSLQLSQFTNSNKGRMLLDEQSEDFVAKICKAALLKDSSYHTPFNRKDNCLLITILLNDGRVHRDSKVVFAGVMAISRLGDLNHKY